MADNDMRKREQVLPPGTYAFIQDGTKGSIKTHVGPCTLTLTAQDKPVRYAEKTHGFVEVTLDEAVRSNVVAPEGYYVVLTNPAKGKDGVELHPEMGRPSDSPDLLIGQKENLPGPVSFALYPGQTAEVRRGHHLRSNEYLRVKVYNEEKARANWGKAVIKTADGSGEQPQVAKREAPSDIAVGKQYNILGTEVSFYIPPTGVSVVPDGEEGGKPVFVRDAETLEQLEYAILVDEDGNKRYPKGPSVVFPRPTEWFMTDGKGNRKFRAIEMNELQGIQLKFMTDVKLKWADGSEHDYRAGEEVFVTGKEMPIYYPEEGHQLVKYDGKTIHYAAAVPEGEARYVMDRKTGEIRTVEGPTMLLPNPVHEIIVRRALSDYESQTWFPGPDGKGSPDALAYNRWLRDQAANSPTTRAGVVSEGQVSGKAAPGGFTPDASGLAGLEIAAAVYSSNSPASFAGAAAERGAVTRSAAGKAMVPSSRQGKNQDAVVGDVAERKSSYNEPRTLTFANKFKGVPTIRVRQGYAVQVADSDGNRKVFVGPKTLLLQYGEALDVLTLSTGKPKNTNVLFSTAYLNVENNRVADVFSVQTSDLVNVELKLIYNVSFEGDTARWFAIENYVKHLCDRMRSLLKARVRHESIEKFYANSTEIVRETLQIGDGLAGYLFEENGMRVGEVEVMEVKLLDAGIGQLLSQAQLQAVKENIELGRARASLAATKEFEAVKREQAQETFLTSKNQMGIQANTLAESLRFDMAKLGAALQVAEKDREHKKALAETADLLHSAELARSELTRAADHAADEKAQALHVALLREQTQAIVDQMKAVDPNLAAALESASARETLVQVARQLGFHQMFGGENAADFLGKAFANTPLAKVMSTALEAAGRKNGNGQSIVVEPA